MPGLNKIQDIQGLNDITNYKQAPYPTKASVSKNNAALRDHNFVYDNMNQMIPQFGGYNYRFAVGSANGALSVGLICLSSNSVPTAPSISTDPEVAHQIGDTVRFRLGNSLRQITGVLEVAIPSGTNWFGVNDGNWKRFYIMAAYTVSGVVELAIAMSPIPKQYAFYSTVNTDRRYLKRGGTSTVNNYTTYYNVGSFIARLKSDNTWEVYPDVTTIEDKPYAGDLSKFYSVSCTNTASQSRNNGFHGSSLALGNTDLDFVGMRVDTNTIQVMPGGEGYYKISGYARFFDNTTGTRGIQVNKFNSGSYSASATYEFWIPKDPDGRTTGHFVFPKIYMNASDYLRFDTYQNSGGALNMTFFSVEVVKLD